MPREVTQRYQTDIRRTAVFIHAHGVETSASFARVASTGEIAGALAELVVVRGRVTAPTLHPSRTNGKDACGQGGGMLDGLYHTQAKEINLLGTVGVMERTTPSSGPTKYSIYEVWTGWLFEIMRETLGQ